VDAQNAFYSSTNGVLLDKSQTTLVEYPPGLVGGYTIPGSVTNIGMWAFSYCANLTDITIADSVASIGDCAFYGCSGLASATIPGSVTSIGADAFCGCASLASVMIPGSVTNLGEGAFYECTSLTNVCFEGNAPLDGGDIFQFDPVTAIYYVSGTVGWGSAYDGLSTAPCAQCGGGHASGSLQVTIIPAGAITAGAQWQVDGQAWQSSGAIVSNLSEGDHTVSFSAISNWIKPANQSITVSANWTTTAFGAYAPFNYSTNNGTITITAYTGPGGAVTLPTNINGLTVTAIGGAAFFGCASLTSVTIPAGVTTIGETAFEGCTSLKNVAFANGLTSIGEAAFQDCANLASVTLPVSVTNLAADAFENCAGLTGVYFNGNAPAADATAFNYDTNATIYYMPCATGWSSTFAGLPSVPWCQALFSYTTNQGAIAITGYSCCALCDSVTIPTNVNGLAVTAIGGSAFDGCADLASVTIPGSVTSIGASAFEYCAGLTNITLNNGITAIGGSAFYGCSNLASVTIPASVTNIGNLAFINCPSLTTITVDTNNLFYSSANGVLFDKNQFTLVEYPGGLGGSYTIPACVTSIGWGAFELCANLASVTIPANVTNIVNLAFLFASNLAGVYFQGNAPAVGGASFKYDTNAIIYYLPGTTGWGVAFGGRPAVFWRLPNPLILNNGSSLGVQSNGLGFTISWATNVSVVVESCTNLSCPVWTPLQTNTLSNGSFNFSDLQWTNYPGRYYRVRSL
jgi:hypothetical protein